MLGEKAQASACKEIIQIVAKQMNSIDFNPENAKDCNQVSKISVKLPFFCKCFMVWWWPTVVNIKGLKYDKLTLALKVEKHNFL